MDLESKCFKYLGTAIDNKLTVNLICDQDTAEAGLINTYVNSEIIFTK